MKINIVRDDAVVGVDGVFRSIDVTDLDPTVYTIVFDTATQKGSVKYNATKSWMNVFITVLTPYQVYVDRWTAAAPPPPPPPPPPIDFSDINNIDKIAKTLALLTRQYANANKDGTFVTKTVAETRTDFMTIYRALP